MHWIIFATAASGGMALFNVASRMTAGKIQPSLSAAIMGAVVFVVLAGYHVWAQGEKSLTIEWGSSGVMWALISGIAVSIINLAMFYAFTKGAPITIAPAYVSVLAVLLTVLAGFVIFNEGIDLSKGAGLGLACVSIYLLMKG